MWLGSCYIYLKVKFQLTSDDISSMLCIPSSSEKQNLCILKMIEWDLLEYGLLALAY